MLKNRFVGWPMLSSAALPRSLLSGHIILRPSIIRYKPPITFTTVNAVDDTASRLPRPITDKVITVMSPNETAATNGKVAFLPYDETYATTVSIVGPGISRALLLKRRRMLARVQRPCD